MKRKIWVYVFEIGLVILIYLFFAPGDAAAQRYDARREIREGTYEVNHERREARREIRTADSPMEARQEIREGYAEVNHERNEARRQVRRSYY